MSTIADYENRTIDLLMFQGVRPGSVRVGLSLGNSGSICTGVQKASQTFALLFLTDLGSVLSDPDRGTNFMSSLRNGTIRDEDTLEAQFSFASGAVLDYEESRRSPDAPDDEIIESVELLDYALTPGSLRMDVRINTIAGADREAILPIEVTIK